MSTIEYDTNYLLVSVYMLVLGAGVGMVMQNLVLIVQNTVAASQLGAASSNVAFFRSLGGTIGVSVMGSVLGTTVKDLFTDRKDDLIAAATKAGKTGMEALQSLQSGTIPEVNKLPGGIRVIVESVYGQSVADIFLIAVPLAVISIIAIAFLPNLKLGTKTALQKAEEERAGGRGAESGLRNAEETVIEVAEALVGSPATGSVPAVSRGDASELQADRPGRPTGRPVQEDR
jgi:hypothetical protein